MKVRLLCLFLLTGCSIQRDFWEFDEISEILSNGKWVYEDKSCASEYRTMSFNLQDNRMILSVNDNSLDSIANYEYQILKEHKDGFLSEIKNEKRLDDNGNPVKWNLILLDDSTFYWSRNDWGWGSGTKNMIKCPSSP